MAHETVQAFRALRTHLAEAGLKLNTDKTETGFPTGSKETAHALKELLTDSDPGFQDSTAAKRRRVPQVRKRFLKGRASAAIAHRSTNL